MKKYLNAEIEVLVFATEDILTASGGASQETEEVTTSWETYPQEEFDYVPGKGDGDVVDF